MLNFLSFCHSNRLARPLARSRIRARSLTANRETSTMANSPVAIDGLKALQVCSMISAEVAFDYPFAVGDHVKNLIKVFFSKVLSTHIGIDSDFLNDKISPLRTDSVNVTEGIRDLLFCGYFNAE